ncbi:MAG: methyltransferase domain-containing protein [Bacteroidota bacterium]|nr:methyltransferase domain-containing protein [Bacteroidota bacterium]
MGNIDYLNGNYFKNNPTWHVEDANWKAQQIIKIIEANRIEPKSICEVGCGAGEILNQLHSRMNNNISFTGYEISPQAYELCKQRTKGRLSFKLLNILDDTESLFDVVLVIDVVEHIEDCFGFLKKIKDKGRFKILHIPLDMSVQKVLRCSPILEARSQVGHIHYFSKETALAMISESGYKIIDYFYTQSAIEVPSKKLKTQLAKFPRKFFFKLNQDLTARILGGYSLLVLAE